MRKQYVIIEIRHNQYYTDVKNMHFTDNIFIAEVFPTIELAENELQKIDFPGVFEIKTIYYKD